MKISTVVVSTRLEAEELIDQLAAAGITENQISVVMSDKTRGAHFGLKESSKVEEGVTVGATAGGVAGAIAGALLAAGTIAIPGVNLVVVGALAPALAGLGAGGVAGGLVGGLIGSGIPEHEAKSYEDDIEAGKILLAVKTETSDQAKRVDEIFNPVRKHGTVPPAEGVTTRPY